MYNFLPRKFNVRIIFSMLKWICTKSSRRGERTLLHLKWFVSFMTPRAMCRIVESCLTILANKTIDRKGEMDSSWFFSTVQKKEYTYHVYSHWLMRAFLQKSRVRQRAWAWNKSDVSGVWPWRCSIPFLPSVLTPLSRSYKRVKIIDAHLAAAFQDVPRRQTIVRFVNVTNYVVIQLYPPIVATATWAFANPKGNPARNSLSLLNLRLSSFQTFIHFFPTATAHC